jgi:uncharacterized membrane protein
MGKNKKRRSDGPRGGGGGGETVGKQTAPSESHVKSTNPKGTMGNPATATKSVISHQQKDEESSMQDWISSLAKQSIEATADETGFIRSKDERKELRAAKKRQRQERQEVKQQQQQERQEVKQQQQQQQTAASASRKGEPQHQAGHGRPAPPTRHGVEISRQRLERLADHIAHCCKSARNTSLVSKSGRKNNDDDDDDEEEPSRKKARRRLEMRLHNLQKKSQPFDKSENKVVCLRKRNWDTPANIQPRTANSNNGNHRRTDYSGMGCARPSLLLSFSDASFMEQLEQEFAEHVPGFFKRRSSKADKKRRDGNMLWRQLQQEKQHGDKNKKNASRPCSKRAFCSLRVHVAFVTDIKTSLKMA